MREEFMREAIRLATESMRQGRGGPFGAVIVRGDDIIACGSNQVPGTNDPTAHAEIVAIREACRRLGRFHLEDCAIYTTCEPCPMCLGAIYWARLQTVVYAATRNAAADAGFIDDFIYREFALPPSQRRIPFQQILRDQALAVLAEWKAKPDKVAY